MWTPSGIPAFDIIMSGEYGKGLPWGYTLELIGDTKVGKTSTELFFGNQVLNDSGVFFLIEPEGTVKTERIKALGIDPKAMRITEFLLFKDALQYIEDRLKDTELLRKGYPYVENEKKKTYASDMKTPVLIVLDTLGAESFKAECKGGYDDKHYPEIARQLGSFFRRNSVRILLSQAILIFVTQKRAKIDSAGGVHYVSPGGNPLQYYSSCKIFMSRMWKPRQDVWKNDKYITSEMYVETNKIGLSEKMLCVDVQKIQEGNRKPGVQPISSVYWTLKKWSEVAGDSKKKIVQRVPEGMKMKVDMYRLPDGTWVRVNNRELIERLWEKPKIRKALIADLKEVYYG